MSDGGVQRIQSVAGAEVVQIGGYVLASRRDPLREAQKWLELFKPHFYNFEHIAVLGYGSGFHILELQKQFDKKITILELHPQLQGMLCDQKNIIFKRAEFDIHQYDLVLPFRPAWGEHAHSYQSIIEELQCTNIKYLSQNNWESVESRHIAYLQTLLEIVK